MKQSIDPPNLNLPPTKCLMKAVSSELQSGTTVEHVRVSNVSFRERSPLYSTVSRIQ